MRRPLKLIATACTSLGLALGLSAPALAQSTATLYGLLDMSVGQFQAAGAPKVWKADSGHMSTSYLGFKGTEDLGGGLRARFAIEHFLRLDQGAAGRFDGDAFWARSAYVGLQGAFGTTVIGRNTTPLFVSTLIFNALGDSFGFSPAIRQLFTPSLLPFFGDTAWNNSLAYASPTYNGWSVNLLGNAGEGAPGSNGRNIGANLLYFNGPLSGTVAFQQVKNGAFGTPPGWSSQDTFQLGASYDLKAAKLFGQYTSVKTKATANSRTTIYGFGASAPVTELGRAIVQFNRAEASDTLSRTETTLSLAYSYLLSKNTELYAVAMTDRITGLATGTTLATGMRLRF